MLSCLCASFPFSFEGGIWDLITIVPDHCLSFNFECKNVGNAGGETVQTRRPLQEVNDKKTTLAYLHIILPNNKNSCCENYCLMFLFWYHIFIVIIILAPSN